MSPKNLSPALLQLVETLRNAGYAIGVQQHIAAQNLLLGLAAEERLPKDLSRLQTLLAPILCSTPQEQKDFARYFKLWKQQQETCEDRQETEIVREAKQLKRGNHWLRAVLSILLFMASLYAVVWYLETTDTQPVAPIEKPKTTQQAPTQPKNNQPETPIIEPKTQADPKLDAAIAKLLQAPPAPQHSPFRQGLDNIDLMLVGQVIVFLILFLAAIAYWLHRYSERFLNRHTSNEEPQLKHIYFPEIVAQLFQKPLLFKIARQLRLHTELPAAHLDVEKTVTRTIEQGGLFTPIQGTMRILPEYLLLVDKRSFRDHQAQMVDNLQQHLMDREVHINRYDFEGDPRLCQPVGSGTETDHAVPLQALVARYPRHRVLIFADLQALRDPLSGKPLAWVEHLRLWPHATLFSHNPIPTNTDSDFLVLPATIDGLKTLAETLSSGKASKNKLFPDGISATPYPPLLRQRPDRWLARHAPNNATLDKLLQQVRDYLDDEESWLWFSACAVYPELHWHLTLYLGHNLTTTDRNAAQWEREKLTGVLSEARLTRLGRLPWFRDGAMPNWLRQSLIEHLNPTQEKQLRRLVESLLEKAVIKQKPDDSFHLDIAERPLPRRVLLKWLRRMGAKTQPRSAWQDRVFVDFVTNPLSVRLPKTLRRLLDAENNQTAYRRLALFTAPVTLPILLLITYSFLPTSWHCQVFQWYNSASSCTFQDTLANGTKAPEMVWLSGGTFMMGSENGNSNERPIHQVRLDAFAMGRYEVTVGEYFRCIAAKACEPPAWLEKDNQRHIQTGTDDDYKKMGKALYNKDHPIVGISWNDATAYAQWLSQETGANYRLPTEAEWEYAARGGTQTEYWWGNTASHDYENYGKDQCCDGFIQGRDQWFYTSPVGMMQANPFGLYDMLGNVLEWTQDRYDANYYANSPTDNPTGAKEGNLRVIRGGAWSATPFDLRSAVRYSRPPSYHHDYLGFRLTRADPPPFYRFTPLKAPVPSPQMIAFENEVSFQMGSEQGNDNEKPVHTVILSPFEIGRYEVTVGEFRQFVEATGYIGEKPMGEVGCKGFMQPDFEQQDNQPVACITWNDAQAYIDWLNTRLPASDNPNPYRLPTEAEWEYAARGGAQTNYWWGDEASHEYANYGKDECCDALAEGKDQWLNTSPVGAFDANLFGLHDTAGNVYEWTQDWYDVNYYANSPAQNPKGARTGTQRVIRGGSWFSFPSTLRSASRFGFDLSDRYSDVGFRLTRTLPRPSNPITPPIMVSLEGGTFNMGSENGRDNEKPFHTVTLAPFDMGKYKVTVGEFKQFVTATGHQMENDCNWQAPSFEQTDQHPVVCVNWNDAMAYAEWLTNTLQDGYTYTLPTEAEWEYAARAGTKTEYWWGDDIGENNANCINCGDSFEFTSPKDAFKPNPFGLHDTAGNVWEWTLDWHDENYYANSPENNPKGAKTGEFRVIRGGAWSNTPFSLRSANRAGNIPSYRNNFVGFRLTRHKPRPSSPITPKKTPQQLVDNAQQSIGYTLCPLQRQVTRRHRSAEYDLYPRRHF